MGEWVKELIRLVARQGLRSPLKPNEYGVSEQSPVFPNNFEAKKNPRIRDLKSWKCCVFHELIPASMTQTGNGNSLNSEQVKLRPPAKRLCHNAKF
jgi:hypothetical protein